MEKKKSFIEYYDENTISVVFGGGIGVYTCKQIAKIYDEKKEFITLCLCELEHEHKIGEEKTTRENDSLSVLLMFNDARSVDVVIKNLLKIRDKLKISDIK